MKLLLRCLFIVFLAGCLLVGGSSGNRLGTKCCLFIVWLAGWLAACSLDFLFIVCLAGCSFGGCLFIVCLLLVWLARRLHVWKLSVYRCLFAVWLAAFSPESARLQIAYPFFVYCPSGCCLLSGSCLSVTVCLLSVWLSVCLSEAAGSEIGYLLCVCDLSSWLQACWKLFLWKLFAHCVFIVCLAETACLKPIVYHMFLVCLDGFLLAGGCLS